MILKSSSISNTFYSTIRMYCVLKITTKDFMQGIHKMRKKKLFERSKSICKHKGNNRVFMMSIITKKLVNRMKKNRLKWLSNKLSSEISTQHNLSQTIHSTNWQKVDLIIFFNREIYFYFIKVLYIFY